MVLLFNRTHRLLLKKEEYIMTLILTELSSLGIVMSADSAVTRTQTTSGLSHVVPNHANKLQTVPYLNAGISCWGMGSINGISTDQWLANFINRNSSIKSLQTFAQTLSNELNTNLPSNPSVVSRLGFHLAGYEDHFGYPTPSFYHIHEGESTTLKARGISVDPLKFNPNHDLPPDEFLKLSSVGEIWITRNGDYQLYAQMFGLLESFFNHLLTIGIKIPNTVDLSERANYLVFQIRTVSELYKMSNLIPGIGGGIHYLTINPVGIHSQGIKYY